MTTLLHKLHGDRNSLGCGLQHKHLKNDDIEVVFLLNIVICRNKNLLQKATVLNPNFQDM